MFLHLLLLLLLLNATSHRGTVGGELLLKGGQNGHQKGGTLGNLLHLCLDADGGGGQLAAVFAVPHRKCLLGSSQCELLHARFSQLVALPVAGEVARDGVVRLKGNWRGQLLN